MLSKWSLDIDVPEIVVLGHLRVQWCIQSSMLFIQNSYSHLKFPICVRMPFLSKWITRATRGPFQYPRRRLALRFREVSKPRDWQLKLSHRFAIWQTHRQHCYRGACQRSERSHNSKYQSQGVRDFARSYNKTPYRILKQDPVIYVGY